LRVSVPDWAGGLRAQPLPGGHPKLGQKTAGAGSRRAGCCAAGPAHVMGGPAVAGRVARLCRLLPAGALALGSRPLV